jgi:hypothetical protein
MSYGASSRSSSASQVRGEGTIGLMVPSVSVMSRAGLRRSTSPARAHTRRNHAPSEAEFVRGRRPLRPASLRVLMLDPLDCGRHPARTQQSAGGLASSRFKDAVLFQWPTGLAVGLGLKETAPPAEAGCTPKGGSPVPLWTDSAFPLLSLQDLSIRARPEPVKPPLSARAGAAGRRNGRHAPSPRLRLAIFALSCLRCAFGRKRTPAWKIGQDRLEWAVTVVRGHAPPREAPWRERIV